MKISKRGVTFLLCLGILASTSLGTLSAFADDWYLGSEPSCETVYPAIEGKDTILYSATEDSKVVLKATNAGYFALFRSADTFNGDPNTPIPFVSLGQETITEFTDVDAYVAANMQSFDKDAVITVAEAGFPEHFYCAYKASKDAAPVIYAVDWSSSAVDDAEGKPQEYDMLNVYTKEETKDYVTFHVSFLDAVESESTVGKVQTSFVYYDDAEDSPEVYAATNTDIANGGYDVKVYANGVYRFTGTNSLGDFWSETFTVNCIEYGGNPADEENADNTDNKPNITVTRSTYDTGLSSDSVVVVTVTADRECDFSCDGFPAVYGSKSAEFNVTENGSYTFIATDSNTGESAVAIEEIRQFGNGDFPDDNVPSNDPPQDDDGITDENKDDYWDKKKDDPNFKDDEGNGVEPLSFDTTNKPSDGMSALPQTGITSWVAMLACAIGAIALGTLLMFRKGIFGRFFGKGGSR